MQGTESNHAFFFLICGGISSSYNLEGATSRLAVYSWPDQHGEEAVICQRCGQDYEEFYCSNCEALRSQRKPRADAAHGDADGRRIATGQSVTNGAK